MAINGIQQSNVAAGSSIDLAEKNELGTFSSDIIEVTSGQSLDMELSALHPGQMAFVIFSATWCTPCKNYRKLKLPELAQSFKGKFKVIYAVNDGKEWATAYGISRFPTASFIDRNKKVTFVDRNNPESDLTLTTLNTPDEVINWQLQKLQSDDLSAKVEAARSIAKWGPSAEKAYPFLLKYLDSENSQLREQSIIAIGNMGKVTQYFLSKLEKILGSKTESSDSVITVLMAVSHMLKISLSETPDDVLQELMESVLTCLDRPEKEIRNHAIVIFEQIGERAQSFVSRLDECRYDEPEPWIRLKLENIIENLKADKAH